MATIWTTAECRQCHNGTRAEIDAEQPMAYLRCDRCGNVVNAYHPLFSAGALWAMQEEKKNVLEVHLQLLREDQPLMYDHVKMIGEALMKGRVDKLRIGPEMSRHLEDFINRTWPRGLPAGPDA